MIRIRVLSLVPAPWTRGYSTNYNPKHTRQDFHPEQNEVSHLHGLVQPLRKVARSVFNTLDWNRTEHKSSVNTLIHPLKIKFTTAKRWMEERKMYQQETSDITAALVNISTAVRSQWWTNLHLWYIFESYLRSMCLPSGSCCCIYQLTTALPAADKAGWRGANREHNPANNQGCYIFTILHLRW